MDLWISIGVLKHGLFAISVAVLDLIDPIKISELPWPPSLAVQNTG
jgi:hypothetical protein